MINSKNGGVTQLEFFFDKLKNQTLFEQGFEK